MPVLGLLLSLLLLLLLFKSGAFSKDAVVTAPLGSWALLLLLLLLFSVGLFRRGGVVGGARPRGVCEGSSIAEDG